MNIRKHKPEANKFLGGISDLRFKLKTFSIVKKKCISSPISIANMIINKNSGKRNATSPYNRKVKIAFTNKDTSPIGRKLFSPDIKRSEFSSLSPVIKFATSPTKKNIKKTNRRNKFSAYKANISFDNL